MKTPDVLALMDQVKTAGDLSHEATELTLWVTSTRDFEKPIEALVKNMMGKIQKKVYDPALAVKLWKHFMDNALRSREFKITYGDWHPTPQNLIEAAQHLSEQYYEAIMAGDYNHLVAPKQASVESDKPAEDDASEEDTEEKTATMLIEALHTAGISDDTFRYALGEQWVAKVVSAVVEQIASRPQLFQTLVDGVIDRIKARL